MKKIIYTLLTTALLALSFGCSDDDDQPRNIPSEVVGEWHLENWINLTPAEFDVYMEFLSDGTFHIYQRVETPVFVRYSGDFTTNGNLLTGRYSSGDRWGADYEYTVNGDVLTLTSKIGSEVSTFKKTTIPEEVRNVHEVRSALPDSFRRLL